jgi:hypothetical protein
MNGYQRAALYLPAALLTINVPGNRALDLALHERGHEEVAQHMERAPERDAFRVLLIGSGPHLAFGLRVLPVTSHQTTA